MKSGIILIDKQQDWTSHDVIAKLRGQLKTRRIGHAGTLDPMATGLLTVCVGQATKAAEYLESTEKTYVTRLQLGTVTDTQDTTGRILSETPVTVTQDALRKALTHFTGEIAQIPPMYSAIQVDGQRLYKLARQGVEIARKPRQITIHKLSLIAFGGTWADLSVTCSKGTYIRTLCHDIGAHLACGGTMAALRRTQVGAYHVQNALTIDDIAKTEDRAALIQPTDTLFQSHPAIPLDDHTVWRIKNGQRIRGPYAPGLCRLYDASGNFFALGDVSAGVLSVKKTFFES